MSDIDRLVAAANPPPVPVFGDLKEQAMLIAQILCLVTTDERQQGLDRLKRSNFDLYVMVEAEIGRLKEKL